ncbi:hypothetical protein [Candidatus Albibeggiatoa sp. nov. NOAA]|uniref:hypothetical protein n=1 Tax=Candidatus Albibeggiatoa sp. nov. NOAA TaxID=3162724 RepID=UPI003301E6FC|nr:hypothetical protein [Thiotrichaceae bacterium]
MKKLFILVNLLLALSFLSQTASAIGSRKDCNFGDSINTCGSRIGGYITGDNLNWHNGFSAKFTSDRVYIYQHGQYVGVYDAYVEEGYSARESMGYYDTQAYMRVQILDGNMDDTGLMISAKYQSYHEFGKRPTYTVCFYENRYTKSCKETSI